jgi:subtilisin family serine protease
MAGPHLVGTVALMWEANPALRGDVARTRSILQATARPFAGGLEGESSLTTEGVTNDVVEGALSSVMNASRAQSCLAQTDLRVVPNNVAGYGVVDVYAAVQAAQAEE